MNPPILCPREIDGNDGTPLVRQSSKWYNMDVNELLNFPDPHPEHASHIVGEYSRRFGGSIIEIQTPQDDSRPIQSDGAKRIYLRGRTSWYHFLHLFGTAITRIKIDYSEFNEAQCQDLHHIIGRTCAVNLVEIKFTGIKPITLIDDLANYQFERVERVEIIDSTLSDRLPLFSMPFPNLRTLKVIDVNMDCFDAYFEHLHRFVIIRGDSNGAKNEINIICKV